MATSRWYIKRGDTLPTLTATLSGPPGSVTGVAPPLNLTSVTSGKLIMHRAGVTLERALVLLAPLTDGMVEYSFLDADWDDIVAGVYKVEFELTYNDNKIRTVPTDDYCQIVVTEDLD